MAKTPPTPDEQLSFEERESAIFKVRTMHEVGKKLKEREPVRKINTV